MECRALVCAHSSIAIARTALQFLKLVKDSYRAESARDSLFRSLDNFLFFGDEDELEAGSQTEEIHLESRAARLLGAFESFNYWRNYFTEMIYLLENCNSQYFFCENDARRGESKSYLEIMKTSFISIATPLRRFISSFCLHFPRNFMTHHIFETMHKLVDALGSFESLSFEKNATSKEFRTLYSHSKEIETAWRRRNDCLSLLKDLLHCLDKLLPRVIDKETTKELCFRVATLIFCTASSSYKLHSVQMKPPNLLIIDEAQQLKECEFAIPSQLPGLQHVILFGDPCQLQASVTSEVSARVGFGRSLFERLSLNRYPKHLLNMQYRMHPSISLFPRSKFYANLILDAPKVTERVYTKSYLPGPLFGPYSFIDISCGKEEMDDVQYSRRNMFEVAVVTKIMQNLYKAWKGSRQQLSVAVTSPCTAQVVEIQDKLGQKYKSFDGFIVEVMQNDELQGKEVDILIFSTVRSNVNGSIGLLSNYQRVNLALTRARHCLWLLGNERTLSKHDSLWKSIICDAKDRNCYFNVNEDDDLAKLVVEVKKELDQLDELLDADSFLFRNARWKVHVGDKFRKSLGKIKSPWMKKLVMNLLLRLANGWRPKRRNTDIICDKSKQILKQFRVKDQRVICSIDIAKESRYVQVLRVWDLLPLVDVPKLVERLDSLFLTYTDDFLKLCKVKCAEGDLEIPMSWEPSCNISVYNERSSSPQEGINLSAEASNATSHPQDFEASESLLLMKFSSLSSGMVSHLLTCCDGTEMELPFELTSQEMEIIHFDRSSFILGRSGTGKTTVLIRKLFQREQLHHIASEGFHELDGGNSRNESTEDGEKVKETEETFLRQIFVTLNPRLCFAVQENVSSLKRFASCGKTSEDCTSIHQDDINDTSWFENIPNSFVGLPRKLYPIAVTLHKFLMMLDGTVGNSFFDRFRQARRHSHRDIRSTKSIALKTFIRMREVTFQKFNLSYWPHFDVKLTKSVDASTVFVEIMSHIKGGLQGQGVHEKLARKDYLLQSGSRMSRLNMQEREKIYDIFLQYEKKKSKNGEYDMADLVIDLHRRLEKKYEGDRFDFVYIDEVQDLTMAQIALFKYICKNVDAGFFFSGDTAQTIAKGIDFRFEDLRCLFYKEFVMKSRYDRIYGKKEKGMVSNTFHLSQNFRTHAGILKLAQSVTNLLYHFFPQSIDPLNPETSLINGETPVLIESSNGKNEFISMFSSGGEGGKSLFRFGAEQVILVRDENIRNEVLSFVGKNALILTISECKGLEFEDVLLYNFLSSSPMEKQWRVIYEYMKDQCILNEESPRSFPSFNEAKHVLLCSELKQLYVAITRTKRKLWIFENVDELSHPMFDYWKQLQTVEVRKPDDPFVWKIQVSSSRHQWKLRGIELFNESNYETAKMCFEKAGEAFLKKWAEAAGLRASAWNISCSNSNMTRIQLEKAARIFDSIGKFEEAAQCFYESEAYEKAGQIYQEKCGNSKLAEAGECFIRAGRYDRAALVYFRGNFFSNCLVACIKGNLFDEGMKYVQSWKEHATLNNVMEKNRHPIRAKEQELLRIAAIHYKKLGDTITMMKFVKSFHSIDSMRVFLKTEGCLDELLQLEYEWKHFQNAANVAKQMGKRLLEVELLEKAECFEDASLAILSYVFAYSLWTHGSVGWPLKHFPGKQELLDKAKLLAKNVSLHFFDLVCFEENLLSDKNISLHCLQDLFCASKRHQSVRGVIMCARKILDIHFYLASSEYTWQANLVTDLKFHPDKLLSYDKASVETLVFFWDVWRKTIEKIFKYLGSLNSRDSYGEFCLNYLGVTMTKSFENNNDTIYLLLNADAFWVKQIDEQHLRRKGNSVRCKAKQFVHAARCYWSSEMLSVGTKVLEKLAALCEFSKQNSLALHHKISPVLHMFGVVKSLIEAKFLHHKYNDRTLHGYLEVSMNDFVGNMFPLDWRKLETLDMTNLRETKNFKNLLEDMINEYMCLERPLSSGNIENAVMVIVGICGGLRNEVYRQVSQKFNSHSFWRTCIGSSEKIKSGFMDVSLVQGFLKDLKRIYYTGCGGKIKIDKVSPGCFMYLLESIIVTIFSLKGCFFSTKSSLLGWLINQKWNENYKPETNWQQFIHVLNIVAAIISELLCNENDTVAVWINSKLGPNRHPLLVLRLFVVLCLLCVNSGKYYHLLFELLGRRDIASLLPQEFYNAIQKLTPGKSAEDNVGVLAYAFKEIDSPLVVVSSENCCIKSEIADAIFVDLQVSQGREELIGILFKEFSEILTPNQRLRKLLPTTAEPVKLPPKNRNQN